MSCVYCDVALLRCTHYTNRTIKLHIGEILLLESLLYEVLFDHPAGYNA